MTKFIHPEELNALKEFLDNLNGKAPLNYDTLIANIRNNHPGTVSLIGQYPAVFKSAPVINAICEVAEGDRIAFPQLLLIPGIEKIDCSPKDYKDVVIKSLQAMPEFVVMCSHLPIGKDPDVAAAIADILLDHPEFQETIDAWVEVGEPADAPPGEGWIPPDPIH